MRWFPSHSRVLGSFRGSCRIIAFSCCLLLMFAASCTSSVIVQGKIAVRGNEPFAYLSIANEDMEYELEGGLAEEIGEQFQGRTMVLRGQVRKGDAVPKLKVLAVISVE
ncbi:MAG: hypothetical protein AAF975_08010 [Spirochaetota bacterium]